MPSKPMFYNAENKAVPIEGLYKGRSCFLILSGPSLTTYDLSKLTLPGVITFGVNNSPKVFRPNLWTMVDHPQNFMISVWKDPRIQKFVPYPKVETKLFDNTKWKEIDLKVKECPNMMYYYRNEHFNHKTFLDEDTINWGCHKNFGGGRSVILAAIRIINLLGFRNVFLLGCDFKMSLDGQNYAFAQDRAKGSVNNNNNTYAQLNERFNLLRPIFEQKEFYVFNCYKDSGLKAFEYMDFDSAIQVAQTGLPDIATENVSGMYDRRSKEKKAREKEERKRNRGKK